MKGRRIPKAEAACSPQELKRLMSYDPDTGIVTRNTARSGLPIGSVVGCLRKDGYLKTVVKKHPAMVHRVAWCLHFGRWPEGVIDHRDGVKANNKISNLRDTTQSGNMLNQVNHRANRSGTPNVDRLPSGRFRARYRLGGKAVQVGIFDDASTAGEACKQAMRQALETQCKLS